MKTTKMITMNHIRETNTHSGDNGSVHVLQLKTAKREMMKLAGKIVLVYRHHFHQA